MEAVNGFLWSSVFHQYTLYPATPFVIPFIIEALESSTLAERDNGLGQPMKRELMHFLRSCAESGQRAVHGRTHPDDPTIEEVIVSGWHLYQRYAADSHAEVQTDAKWLLQFCHTNAHVS